MLSRRAVLGAGWAILAAPFLTLGAQAQQLSVLCTGNLTQPAGSGGTTQNFTDAQIANGFSGFFDTLTNSAQRRWQSTVSTNIDDAASGWEGGVTGHTLVLTSISTTAGLYYASVDGCPYFPLSGGTSVTVFANLRDTRHYVSLVQTTNLTTNPVTPLTGTVMTVTGSAPAIDFGAWAGGPVWMVTDPSFPGNYSGCSVNAGFGANVRPTNDDTLNGYQTGTSSLGFDSGCGIEFQAKCSAIWVYTGETCCYVSVDQTNPESIQTRFNNNCPNIHPINSGPRSWQLAASGLDETTMHDYSLFVGSVADQTTSPRAGVTVDSPTLYVRLDTNGTFGPKRTIKRVNQFGDSITVSMLPAVLGCNPDSDVYMYSCLQGALGATCGANSATVAALDSDMATNLRNRNYVPDVAVVAIGRNDVGTPTGAFEASYTSVLNKILANGTNKIICRGVALGQAGFTALDASIQAVVAAIQSSLTGSQQVLFQETVTWTGIAFYPDDTHPTQAGYQTMVNYWTPVLTATGWFP